MNAQVSIKLHDLVSAGRSGKLNDVILRDAELARLVRSLLRPTHHHVALIGEPGTGKSSLLEALALRLGQGQYKPLAPKLYRLDADPLANMLASGENVRSALTALTQATTRLDTATIIIEDIQLLAADDANRLEHTMALLKGLASGENLKLIVTTTATAYHRIFRDDYTFARMFDVVHMQPATPTDAAQMVVTRLPKFAHLYRIDITKEAVDQAVELGARYGHGRSLPDAAIRLLEEASVQASLEGHDAVNSAAIKSLVAERENLPMRDLDSGNSAQLEKLESNLLRSVIGQNVPLRTIARTIAKSQLGLGDATRPRGSFLLLGPSGVGKTETAKALAKHVFANPSSLVRLDMSEYSEAHSAIRLIGSPPGYVGYEEGGQLTGAVAKQPYSLILLDEIEKAHPKLFDLFLQLLDDGRLTDSAGQTVDFTETIVIATSNVGASEISQMAPSGADLNDPNFIQSQIMPILLKQYRPEFINRFDAILVYEPLTLPHLVALAKRELAALEQKLSKLHVTFEVEDATINRLLAASYNPLFGARPVKRLIATHFETPLADKLIRRELQTPVVIKGTEPWLSLEQVQ